MKWLVTLALLVVAPLTARAQAVNFNALDEGTNLATVATGAEYGLVLGLGYGHVLAVADRPVVLAGELALQWAEVDVSDFRIRAGAYAPLVGRGRWKLIGGLTSIVRGTSNDAARMLDVGADVALLAGHYAPRWFAAAEAGFDWAIATRIAPSDTYRMQVYADARDGWYAIPGGMFRYGIQGGITFGDNDVVLRAGQQRDIAGELPLFPFYATLGYDRRW